MPPAVATSTIKDVELVSVGEWPASTGATRVTRAHLEACLAAAADNDVDHAPIRIGHVDPRFDGEPALGWVRPTGIVDTRRDGRKVDTLVGDIIGIPSRLSEVAPTAFRRRSVELAWDVTTPAGKTYPVVLAGLALLGVAAPAVKGLSDVLALFAGDTTRTAPHRPASARLELVDGLEDNPSAVVMLAAARDNGATPAQLDAMATAAGARDTTTLPQPTPDPPHDGPEPPPANRGEPMPRNRTLTDAELRRLLEQESDVDVEATIAGIRDTSSSDPDPANPSDPANPPTPRDPSNPDPTPPANPTDPAPSNPGNPGTGAPSPAPEPSNPSNPDPASREPELVTMSAGQWQQVQRDVEWARTRRRDEVLDGAIREGRIAPSERSAFAAQLERDEDGTTHLLSTLSAGRVPTHERGADFAHDVAPSDDDWQQFEESIGAGPPPAQ